MGRRKKDLTQQKLNHGAEGYYGQSAGAYGHFALQNTREGKKIRDFIADVRNTYERMQMLGLPKDAKKHLNASEAEGDFMFVDCSSADGIPDCISVRKLQEEQINESAEERMLREERKKEMLENLMNDSEWPLVYDAIFHSPGEISFPMRDQLSSGTINKREEAAINMAAYLNNLSVASFITKASLYMARATNRHRKNINGDQYTLGELYLLMEHGLHMREAYTKYEVCQALDEVGLVGCKVAYKVLEALDRISQAREERQGEISSTPTYGRKVLNKFSSKPKKGKRKKRDLPSAHIEENEE